MRLEGKVAIVTGGTSGIGRAIVERFAREGAAIVFSGRRAGLGREVARGSGATFVEADVSVESDGERTIRTALDRHGRLDVLVNNAGTGSRNARLENTPLKTFDEIMAIHVRGALVHMKHASAIMRLQKAGSIVNISSIAAHRVGFGSLSYSTAKAALNHLSRCAALELGEDGVRVNSISAGGIATGIFGKILGLDPAAAEASVEKVKAALKDFQPIPRAGLPDDIASVAVFLASDESSFVNGEDIVVDGGLIGGRRYSEVKAAGRANRAALE
ncbi:MAG: SDR family oxidoreductase [Bauldia sp.]|nr:SDR family oxidoreductase [Bauldia sp.]